MDVGLYNRFGVSFAIIVQARMGSKRLPHKVLIDICGKPLFSYVLESLDHICPRESIILATSDSPENDIFVEYCLDHRIGVYRGDETDVASRFHAICSSRHEEYFVRINADSPLIDYRIIEHVLQVCSKKKPTIASTSVGRHVLSGMNVEAVKSEIFCREYAHFTTAHHFEHVTQYFYETRKRWNICEVNLKLSRQDKACKFSVDTLEDLERVRAIVQRMDKPHTMFSLQEKVDLYKMVSHGQLC